MNMEIACPYATLKYIFKVFKLRSRNMDVKIVHIVRCSDKAKCCSVRSPLRC